MGLVLDRGNRTINQQAVDRLAVGGAQRVLEVGFGGGGTLARILARTDARVAGVEISDAMLSRARRRFRRELADGRLELERASVAELPYPSESFDRVLTVQTIYFWPDPPAGLRELRRVLEPGGRIVIATAAREEMEKRSFTRHGFRKFSEQELHDLVRQAGFDEVSVDRDGPRVFTTGTRR